MAPGPSEMTEIRVLQTRLDGLEQRVNEISRGTVSEGLFQANLATIRAEMAVLKVKAEALAEELKAATSEETQKRLLVYGAMLAAVGSLVVSIIMGGG